MSDTLDHRYLVFKLSDIEATDLTCEELLCLKTITDKIDSTRTAAGKPSLHGLFIEQDWPEYPATRAALQRRVKQETCSHPRWVPHQIADEGYFCVECGLHTYEEKAQ